MDILNDKGKKKMNGKGAIQETMQEVKVALDNIPMPKTTSETIAIGVAVALLGALAVYVGKRMCRKLFGKKTKRKSRKVGKRKRS